MSKVFVVGELRGGLPARLAEQLDDGGCVVVMGRNSGEGPLARRAAAADAAKASRELRLKGVDVMAAMPSEAEIEQALEAASGAEVRRSADARGNQFTNTFAVIDRRSDGLIVLTSTGSGDKLDAATREQPFIARVTRLVDDVLPCLLWSSLSDRLKREDLALAPLLLSQRELALAGVVDLFIGDAGGGLEEHSDHGVVIHMLRGGQARRQALELSIRTRKGAAVKTHGQMRAGRVAYSMGQAVPPDFARVRLRSGVATETGLMYVDTAACRPAREEVADHWPQVVDDAGEPVDQAEIVRWLLASAGKPGWGVPELAREAARRRFSTDGLRSQNGPAAHCGTGAAAGPASGDGAARAAVLAARAPSDIQAAWSARRLPSGDRGSGPRHLVGRGRPGPSDVARAGGPTAGMFARPQAVGLRGAHDLWTAAARLEPPALPPLPPGCGGRRRHDCCMPPPPWSAPRSRRAGSDRREGTYGARAEPHPGRNMHEDRSQDAESGASVGFRPGVALCLSGGGYRAALFHLGAVRRLNELGVLSTVDLVSSVSGGSSLSAHLAERLRTWPPAGEAAAEWESTVALPFRAFCRRNIRTGPFLRRCLPWNWFGSTSAVDSLSTAYQQHLTAMRLPELPARPKFVFCATDMSYGVNWEFSRERVGDYQAGYVRPAPDWPVARAVAASSCFPPVFNPMRLGLDPARLASGSHRGPARDEAVRAIGLTDGGVYDNLALEPAWKSHGCVLVSDGGGTFDALPDSGLLWRLQRYTAIASRQAGALRTRWLISRYKAKTVSGCYWGIGNTVRDFDGQGGYSRRVVDMVARIRTDMDAFSEGEQAVLENHGYAIADAAIRRWAPQLAAPKPFALPHPDWQDDSRAEKALRDSHRRRLPCGRR
jgi:NTE family protein